MARLMEIVIAQGKPPAELIVDALNEHDTVQKACESLDMDPSAIYRWMNKLGIQRKYVIAPQTKNPSKSA